MRNDTKQYRSVSTLRVTPVFPEVDPVTSATSETPALDPRVARSRAKVLEAATALLIETGPRSVTVDAVSELSGVAKSTLYRHWESRRDLIVDVFRSNDPGMLDPDPDLGFVDALREVVDSMADSFTDPVWRQIFPSLLSMRTHLPEVAEIFDADHDGHIEMFAAVLARGVAEGVLPGDVDPMLTLHFFVGPIMIAAMTEKLVVVDVAEFVLDRFLASYA